MVTYVQPRDLALVLSSDIAKTGAERFPLDKLRMQKAVFLIAMRGTDRLRALYAFEPYNWGPYSGALTSDVRELVNEDYLTIEKEPLQQYGRYRTTPDGEEEAAVIWESLAPKEREFVRTVRGYVTSKSFNHLLREVYAAYPEYAANSRFTG
jgi:uncharacterized protein